MSNKSSFLNMFNAVVILPSVKLSFDTALPSEKFIFPFPLFKVLKLLFKVAERP